MDAKLKVIDGAKDTVIRLKLPTVVGRGAESSLKVPQSEVSRSHCEIYEEDGLLAIFDLGSSNGTFVNGERIEDPTFLYPGDHLRIGKVTLEAVYEAADVPAKESSVIMAEAVPDEDSGKKSPPKDPVKRTADSSSGLSGVAAVVDYSESAGGSFIAIESIDAGDAPAAVSSVDLDTGAEHPAPSVSGFSIDADGEDGSDVEGGDSKLNDFFRNLE